MFLQGLATYPKDLYDVQPYEDAGSRPGHALMLRSHKLQQEEVATSVRCIARCGAGTNNIRKFSFFCQDMSSVSKFCSFYHI
jgi:hypothetical protein